jgi:hypothetical protein
MIKDNFKKGSEAIKMASKVLQNSINMLPKFAKQSGLGPEEMELFANIRGDISNALKTRDVSKLQELKNKAEALQKKYKQ